MALFGPPPFFLVWQLVPVMWQFVVTLVIILIVSTLCFLIMGWSSVVSIDRCSNSLNITSE